MDLLAWYSRKKLEKRVTIAQMAKDLGCSRNHLNQILLSERLPSHQLGRKIEFYTKQQVTYAEIVDLFFKLHPERYKHDFE